MRLINEIMRREGRTMESLNRPQNVLLITYDALRPDYLGVYGHDKDTSPNIDKIASKGVLFENAIANGPNTFSSMQSLLTSTYPFMYEGYDRVSRDRTLISEVFAQESSVKTAGFHSNPYLSSFFGYHRGFDVFRSRSKKKGNSISSRLWKQAFDILDNSNDTSSIMSYLEDKFGGLSRRIGRFTEKMYGLLGGRYLPTYAKAEELTDYAISWLTSLNSSDAFFLWLHYMDAHAPYNPPSEYLSQLGFRKPSREVVASLYHKKVGGGITEEELPILKALYQGEICYMDHETSRLLDFLKENNLLEETLIILTADHGEEFNEHGYVGHREKLYDELLHVPLIIRYNTIEQKVIDKQVELLDIAPTICDFMGLKPPASYQGSSLLPLLKGEDVSGSEMVISEVKPDKITGSGKQKKSISLRTENWKYILHESKKDELYNLRKSSNEDYNLIEKKTDAARLMRRKLLLHRLKEMKSSSNLKNKIKSRIEKVRS